MSLEYTNWKIVAADPSLRVQDGVGEYLGTAAEASNRISVGTSYRSPGPVSGGIVFSIGKK